MRHLPLLIAVFLILAAGFLASTIQDNLTAQAVYSSYKGDYSSERPYREPPSWRLDPDKTVPLERFDFNKDGIINIEDVREHSVVLRRCIVQLWGPWCVPELDVNLDGRYEYRDNTILYDAVTNPVSSGLSFHESQVDRTDDCELGKLRCLGDKRYSICGNYDLDEALEFSGPFKVDTGKACRYGKIVTPEFEENY